MKVWAWWQVYVRSGREYVKVCRKSVGMIVLCEVVNFGVF